MNPRFELDPRPHVRAITAVFFILLAVGPFSLVYVPSAVFVPGDGAATATNLVEQGGLYRLGLLGELTIALTEGIMLVALWRLFQPVSETLAALAGWSRAAMATLQGVALVPGLLALSATDPDQVLTLFAAREATTVVWQAFFAVHCLVLGVLIVRSGLVPSVFGYLMSLAGLGYLAMAVEPVVGTSVLTDVAQLVALAEIPFFLWMLARGVSTERWRALTT